VRMTIFTRMLGLHPGNCLPASCYYIILYAILLFQLMLFEQPDLLPDRNQRITILFLLYEMYRSQPLVKNPFAPLFVHLLSDVPNKSPAMQITMAEKMFLFQLVTSPALTREVWYSTLKEAIYLI